MSEDLEALRAEVETLRLKAEIRKLKAEAEPKHEETEKEMLDRLHKEAQKQHDIMFAASGIKPVLRRVK